MNKSTLSKWGYGFLALLFYVIATMLPMILFSVLQAFGASIALPKDFFMKNQNMAYCAVASVLGLIYASLFLALFRKDKRSGIVMNGKEKVGLVVCGAFAISGISMLWLLFADYCLSWIPAVKEAMSAFNQNADSINQGSFVWIFLAVCLIGPIIEELMFRGLIYNTFRRVFKSPVPAIVLSGVMFGIWHGNLIQTVYTSIMGMIVAYVYYKTGRLIFPILIHMLNNIISTPFPIWHGNVLEDIINYGSIVMIIPFAILVYKVFLNRKRSNLQFI